MKKSLKLFVILSFNIFFINTNGYSQNMYIIAGSGYNLSAGADRLGTSSSSGKVKNVYGTFGEGLTFNAGIGGMFNEHIGCELIFSVLSGRGIKYYDYSSYSEGFSSSHLIRAIPALKLTFGNKIKPYAKFGVLISVNNEINFESSSTDNSFPGYTTTRAEKAHYSGGLSTGVMGAFGFDFIISKKISIFSEINTINQTWGPGKVEYTSSVTVNGQYSSSSSTEILVDEIANGPSQSNERLKPILPFGSIGIQAGVKFIFGNNNSVSTIEKKSN